jgi:glutaredoxin
MTPEEEKKIEQWGQKLNDKIRLNLILTKNKRSELFRDFCDSLARIVPKIKVKVEHEEDPIAPVIRIGNVGYQAIPAGEELEPFLNVLNDSADYVKRLPLSIRDQLDKLKIPALLKIYITPQCPFCPATVKQLLSLAAVNEYVKLTIIDGTMFSEMAESDNIHSAPTVLLDDQFRWSGSVKAQEIVDIILNRDPSQLSAASLKSMFEEGDAVKVANMILDSGKIFPALMGLLVDEKWPVRLGAMVAFETIALKDSKLAAYAVPFLWKSFPQAKDTVKGDILYLLGQTGDDRVIPKLETVLNGPYPLDIKEAAEEALEAFNR